MQHEMKFKLQILQWCILVSDPIPMKKKKRKPITFVCNKDANAFLVLKLFKL